MIIGSTNTCVWGHLDWVKQLICLGPLTVHQSLMEICQKVSPIGMRKQRFTYPFLQLGKCLRTNFVYEFDSADNIYTHCGGKLLLVKYIASIKRHRLIHRTTGAVKFAQLYQAQCP